MTLDAPASVSHSTRHQVADTVDAKGTDDVSSLLDALRLYLSDQIGYEPLREAIREHINEHVDVPLLDEQDEGRVIGLLCKGVEGLLRDLKDEGRLPAIASDLVTGEMHPSELSDELQDLVEQALDLPGPQFVEDAIFSVLQRIARSIISEVIRP
jgi:hypothetical protein